MPKAKTYLGDAVYAEINVYDDLILTTEDGIKATNRIVLEPSVRAALAEYLTQHAMEGSDEDEHEEFLGGKRRGPAADHHVGPGVEQFYEED